MGSGLPGTIGPCGCSSSSHFPGASTSESPYDGIESEWPGTENGFTWPFQFTDLDCDDTDPAVAPFILSDPPYDGIDADCEGDNDFDDDGDGYFWEGVGETAYATFCTTYPDAWQQHDRGGLRRHRPRGVIDDGSTSTDLFVGLPGTTSLS